MNKEIIAGTDGPKILDIVKVPNEILSKNIMSTVDDILKWSDENFLSQYQQTFDDMIYTMERSGGVGLSANQVGLELPVFVMNDGIRGAEVMICPQIVETEGVHTAIEGCLSIPDKGILAPRFWKIRLAYIDRHGVIHKTKRSGWSARIIQHEIQHLFGTTLLAIEEKDNLNKG